MVCLVIAIMHLHYACMPLMHPTHAVSNVLLLSLYMHVLPVYKHPDMDTVSRAEAELPIVALHGGIMGRQNGE